MHETQWDIAGSDTADEQTAFGDEIARLERIRGYLQKDVAVKDAYLAAIRADLGERDAEILALRQEIARLHAAIRETLSQPRYRVADAVNRSLGRLRIVRHLLKLALVKILAWSNPR